MKIELNKVATIKDTEVSLFKKMSEILSKTYRVTFIGETHQQYISFQSPQVKTTAIREISDLWIIVFSPSKKRIRTTFLQAKYHRGILDVHNRKFNADYFQYELLAKRPKLNSIRGQRFNFPLDILSFSCCDSIGSYGVFFIDKSNQIDLAYSCANAITPQSPLPTIYSSFKVDLEIPFIVNNERNCFCNVCKELISCFDIDTFTQSILNLQIGAEIIHYPGIIKFVQKVLAPFHNEDTIKDLNNLIDNLPPDNTNANVNIGVEGIPTNILAINTDV